MLKFEKKILDFNFLPIPHLSIVPLHVDSGYATVFGLRIYELLFMIMHRHFLSALFSEVQWNIISLNYFLIV